MLGEPADPIVAFDRDQATVRGIPEPLPWTFSGRLSRSRAVLGSGEKAIMLETAGWRPQATVEVQGEWEERDLVVLACFFAAIARRRRSTFVGSAVPGRNRRAPPGAPNYKSACSSRTLRVTLPECACGHSGGRSMVGSDGRW